MSRPALRPAHRRPPFGAAAAAALALTITSCSGSDGGATVVTSGAPAPATAAPSTAAATTAPATSAAATTAATAAPAPAGPTVDAAALLRGTVDSLRPGYDVDTNVTAGDRVTNVAGRVIGANSLFTLSSGGAAVEYLQVPPQVWVREPGGEWTEASSESAPTESLGPLAAPASIAFVRAAPEGQYLRVTYPGAALGSESTTVEAEMVLETRGGLTVTYAAITQGKPVTVVTRLAPAGDPTPIGPPA